MNKSTFLFFIVTFAALFVGACSSGDSGGSPLQTEDSTDNNDSPESTSDVDSQEEESPESIDANSLASNGCENVITLNGYGYAACGDGIEIIDLESLERNFLSQPADDIAGDADLEVLFTQSENTLQQFDLIDPMQPNVIATVNTNFALFSGISAANGILVVSAGSGGANTEVYTYDATSLTLALAGIPVVDNRTGNPDVHVAATEAGALAFYSQDLGAVANWGIQIVEFDTNGNILALPDVVVLTPGQFTGSFGVPFGPANFPLESEFLFDRLYAAHFAANGIQVIDRSASDALSLIPLGYEPTNIATDGSQLFVVGVERSFVDIINVVTDTVVDSISLPLQQPTGIAASATHILVADRSAGLIVMRR